MDNDGSGNLEKYLDNEYYVEFEVTTERYPFPGALARPPLCASFRGPSPSLTLRARCLVVCPVGGARAASTKVTHHTHTPRHRPAPA